MSLIIEAPREIEAALEAKAARLGVPVERYALGVLRRDVEGNGAKPREPVNARAAARLASLRAAVETSRRNNQAAGIAAPLSDWALSRAGAYEDASQSL